MLMKLTTGVDFINVLFTAFGLIDPECAKRQSSQQCHLVLLRPTSVKYACRMLMKSSPSINFINILQTAFSYKSASFLRVWLC